MSANQESKDELAQRMLTFFSRHVVVIAGKYFDLDPNGCAMGLEKTYIFSGWVLEILDRYVLVTAGHAVKAVIEAERAKRIHVTGRILADHYGPEPMSHVPLVFDLSDQAVD